MPLVSRYVPNGNTFSTYTLGERFLDACAVPGLVVEKLLYRTKLNARSTIKCLEFSRTAPQKAKDKLVHVHTIVMNGTEMSIVGEAEDLYRFRDAVEDCTGATGGGSRVFSYALQQSSTCLFRRNAHVWRAFYHSFNYWHFVVDFLFGAYVLTGHLSMELQCPAHSIEFYYHPVFVLADPDPKTGLVPATLDNMHFFPLAELVLGKIRPASEMTGCFNTVTFGSLSLTSIPDCMHRRWWYGHRQASWWHAFAIAFRDVITSQHGAIIDSASLLVVHHHRMPQWLGKFEFDAQVATSFGVRIKHVALSA